MGIELTQLSHNYSRIEEINEDNTCIIDTSTKKGKILYVLGCVASIVIVVGAVVGLAFLFALL